jgi:hypothetical protein
MRRGLERLFVAMAVLFAGALLAAHGLAPLVRSAIPSSYHASAAVAALPHALLCALIASVAFAAWFGRTASPRDFAKRSPLHATAAMCAAWLPLPLAIYLATLNFTQRSLYLPAIPFCVLLALGIVASVQRVGAAAGRDRAPPSALLAASIAVAAVLLARSPLFGFPRDWRESGRIAELALERLSRDLANDPPASELRLVDFPQLTPNAALFERSVVTGPSDYSVHSWLALAGPWLPKTVTIESRTELEHSPASIEFEHGLSNAGSLTMRAVAR